MPHRLSDQFLGDLKEGILNPLIDRVKSDPTLCLEIREDYINIYYRGGNLLRISRKPDGYAAFFDPEYASGDGGAFAAAMPVVSLRSPEDVAVWLSFFPNLKLAMDLYLGRHPKEEREAQQHILRENNFGGVSRATDYFICDIEYANMDRRFDLVAVHWPSNGAIRKRADGHRLVLVEAKFGEGALDGPSGLHSHILKINQFLSSPGFLCELKREMVDTFNQKRELGLVNCGKALEGFSDEPPVLLLVLVNHDPDSTKLRRCLETLPPSPHAHIYLATSCFMGYGLFDQAILPLVAARERWGALI